MLLLYIKHMRLMCFALFKVSYTHICLYVQNGRAMENRTPIYSVKGNYPKPLDDDSVKMVAPVGLEPTTNSLKANCSTN